jgi:hypothetical protein
MKIRFLLLSILSFQSLLAQGTLEFHATLLPDRPDGVDWTSGGEATFFLNGNKFSGTAFYDAERIYTFARVENSKAITISETADYEIIAIGELTAFVQSSWAPVTISDAQKSELLAGDWNVSIFFGETTIAGKLEVVPEPGAWALFGLGSDL